MAEALIFLLNLVVVTYLCWRVVQSDKPRQKGRRATLGLLAYKDDAES